MLMIKKNKKTLWPFIYCIQALHLRFFFLVLSHFIIAQVFVFF